MYEWLSESKMVKAADMKPCDVFRCAFGEDDNYIIAVFESATPCVNYGTEINYHTLSGKKDKMYDSDSYDRCVFEVIGHEHL